MRKAFFLFFILFLLYGSLNGQDPKILKGVSELRKVIFENYESNLKQVELIRQKLDSVGVDKSDFLYFCSQLDYVSKNLYSGELANRGYLVDLLKRSKSYKHLTEIQRAIILKNIDLIYFLVHGFWDDKFPHKIKPYSEKCKEISNYGVKEGDKILHYLGHDLHLCDILFFSYDSIQISHYPHDFDRTVKEFYDLFGSCWSTDEKKINYPITRKSKLDKEARYDKIFYDATWLIHTNNDPSLKRRMKEMYTLLKDDGQLIISANTFYGPFDIPFFEKYTLNMDYMDKTMNKILKFNFELSERIVSEDEYVVYKFSKVID